MVSSAISDRPVAHPLPPAAAAAVPMPAAAAFEPRFLPPLLTLPPTLRAGEGGGGGCGSAAAAAAAAWRSPRSRGASRGGSDFAALDVFLDGCGLEGAAGGWGDGGCGWRPGVPTKGRHRKGARG